MSVSISDYQAYLNDEGTVDYLVEYCKEHERKMKSERYFGGGPMGPGSQFRVTLPSVPDSLPYRIRVLKLAEGEYRFGHTAEELDAVRILHGLPDDPPW